MKDVTSFPLVKIKGKYLHSPYNPLKEAERVIRNGQYSDKTYLILFEPGLGYLAELLLERYRKVRLLIISPLDLLKPTIKSHERVSWWKGDMDGGLRSFLAAHLHESDINSLAYIPWPPAVRLLPGEASMGGATISAFLKMLQANHAHLTGFGYVNLKNSFINYLESPTPRLPRLSGVPVVIAASGPSLEENRQQLKGQENNYFIVALPSAVRALQEGGIRPHMILSTDPGYWASRHFRHFPSNVPVGTGLNGRRANGSGHSIYPVINQLAFADQMLLEGCGLPQVESTGSVALTALEFARALNAPSVTFAGLDLCMRDIKSHASPHSFDTFLSVGTDRFSSIHQIHYERVSAMTAYRKGPLRFGHALEQYKSWLSVRKGYPALYRLSGDTPHISGVEEISRLKPAPPFSEIWYDSPLPPLSHRYGHAKSLLRLWVETAGELFRNGNSLLLPDQSGFKDFLYTLVPEEYARLKKELILGREGKLLLRDTEDRIMDVFSRLEALIERLSFKEP